MSKAYHCAAHDCSNGGYKLKKWKDGSCSIHNSQRSSPYCSCEPDFKLYPFPTRGTDPENRRKWQQLINRQDKKGKLWSPSKDSRVCSRHFKEGRPTEECPYPTENLGYDSTSKVANILQPQKRRRIHRHTLVSLGKNVKDNELNSEDSDSGCYIQSQGDNETLSPAADPENASEPAENQSQRESEPSPDNNIDARPDNESSGFLNNFVIILLFLKLITSFTKLSSDVTKLTAQVKRLQWQKKQNILKIRKLQEELRKCTCNQPLHSNLLKTDEDVQFYTGLQSKGMFDSLHDFIAPFVKRRWKGVSRVVNKVRRPIFQQQKQRVPQRKLPSKDEFLLTMKRLKLALLHLDLAKRFKISRTLSGQIFNSWLRAMSTVLRPVIYMPEQGVINVTSPKRFHGVRNVHSIIDCSELFIETPQDHDLRAVTWSTYEHHNTIKFLIAVAPNSSILYISPAYSGRISDKDITNCTGYLDMVPAYSVLMCDKGFQIEQECLARQITHYIPPGKRGMSQMGNVEVAKTSRIAKLRILVEQVIRKVKSFRILSSEIPITLIPQIDDILLVCAAFTNMKEPIFKD